MLPALNQAASRMSWRALFVLGLAAAAMLALPMLKWAPAAKPAAADDKGSAAQSEKNDKGSSAAQSDKKSVESGTAPKAPALVEYLPRPSKDEQKILASLSKPTTVEFLDLPLEDCITFLAVYHDLNVWLDKGTLADEGVALDQPITLKLAGVSFRSVLNLVLQPLQLTYVVEDDVMKITTRAKAAQKLFTRTYPVGDLYLGRVKADDKGPTDKGAPKDKPAVRRPGDLENAIMNAVEPDSWETLSGPGTCTYVEKSGSLVIRQTWGAHTKIVDLLRDLREAKGTPSGDKQ